ncbi:DUF2493 domain-containing protein [Planctomycetota bacterium]|nr:DUF2493 domain-containing protein [Planctomycetota bacterium]
MSNPMLIYPRESKNVSSGLKCIIAGSHNLFDVQYVNDAMEDCPFADEIGEVVSGGAIGIDRAGEEWARLMGLPIRVFPLNWQKHGRAAGPVRNLKMAEYADVLVAIWDGESKETRNMIKNAEKLGLIVHLCIVIHVE